MTRARTNITGRIGMDSKEAKALREEMKLLRQAIEQQNKLTMAVLKTSGGKVPQTLAEQRKKPSPFTNVYGG